MTADHPALQPGPLDALPPMSGHRRRRDRLVGRLADAALELRQRAMGVGRELDSAAASRPARRVLVLGVYTQAGAASMEAAVSRLQASSHDVRVALGSLGPAASALTLVTAATEMAGGKLANVNRLAEEAAPGAADWILLLDDDVVVPRRRFLDRLVFLAEHLRLDIVQPALSRSSHTAFEVTRRRPLLARLTRFVEVGPLTAFRGHAFRALTPFPESGMGWGVDLHWSAVAERKGWRLGVLDAVPVRHDQRPTALGYDHSAAQQAAVALLSEREHITHVEAEQVIEAYPSLS
jgi:hypothetical protein